MVTVEAHEGAYFYQKINQSLPAFRGSHIRSAGEDSRLILKPGIHENIHPKAPGNLFRFNKGW